MSEKWTKLDPIKGNAVCGTCGCGSHDTLPMSKVIAVGFGSAGYSKDGKTLWCEDMGREQDFPTAQDVEELAKKDPDADWRIFFYAPLYDAVYQRQGEHHWVLVKKGKGFA